jgi:cell division protein FtsW
MAWYMGFPLKKILVLWGWAILIASVWVLWLSVVNPDNYAYQRIKTFFTTDEQEKKDIELKEWWQIQQWLIAIWAWGFFWQWYGKWLQKMWQLPEAYSDMIFAAFSEEIGFVWNMILFLLYIWLFIVVLKRIPYLKDPQMKVLCVWIISLITIQVFVHVGVNVEVLPNTWLTLPFISHGGTALLINLVELMILYKILNSVKERSEREIRIDNE